MEENKKRQPLERIIILRTRFNKVHQFYIYITLYFILITLLACILYIILIAKSIRKVVLLILFTDKMFRAIYLPKVT